MNARLIARSAVIALAAVLLVDGYWMALLIGGLLVVAFLLTDDLHRDGQP